jgi:hypothetical protein
VHISSNVLVCIFLDHKEKAFNCLALEEAFCGATPLIKSFHAVYIVGLLEHDA